MQAQNKNMANVAKTQNKTKKQSVISKQNRKKIINTYYQLYRAFLLKNLMSGMTLGAASHNAIQMVRAKLSTMDKTNPVTEMLLRVNARHARRVTKRVMTSKYRDARAIMNADQRTKLTAVVAQLIKHSLGTINMMLNQYKPKHQENTKIAPAKTRVVAKPTQPQLNIMLVARIKQMNDMRQRAA